MYTPGCGECFARRARSGIPRAGGDLRARVTRVPGCGGTLHALRKVAPGCGVRLWRFLQRSALQTGLPSDGLVVFKNHQNFSFLRGFLGIFWRGFSFWKNLPKGVWFLMDFSKKNPLAMGRWWVFYFKTGFPSGGLVLKTTKNRWFLWFLSRGRRFFGDKNHKNTRPASRWCSGRRGGWWFFWWFLNKDRQKNRVVGIASRG